MKYSIILILVVVAFAVTDGMPSSMKQYNDFNKFVEFIKLICEEKVIDNERLGEILKDPIFYEKYVPEESDDKSIRQIQMLICPKERQKSVNQEVAQKNSKAMKFTNTSIQTILPAKSFSFGDKEVFDATTQNKTHLEIAKDSVHTPYKDAPVCSKGSAIMKWFCNIAEYLLHWLRFITK